MSINLIVNFAEDFKQFVLVSIQKYFNIDLENPNYTYLKELPPQDLYIRYIADSKRIPYPKPRKVYISKELKENNLYNKYYESIKNIINIFEEGKTIKPYLNKDVKHIFKKNCPKDYLLNDWDLYHIHLGQMEVNAKFCSRTKDVLFCRITDTAVYLIQILDHCDKSSFASRKLLTILRENWIEQYNVHKIKSILGLETEFNDREYRQLREAGITTILNIDGDYCFAPNLGVASSGDSAKDVEIALQQFRLLDFLQNHIIKNTKIIYEFIIKCNYRHKKPTKIYFKLKYIDENLLIAQDIFSKAIVELKIKNQYISEMIIRINNNSYTIQYNLK